MSVAINLVAGSETGPWLRLVIDDWSLVIAKSQVLALEESKRSSSVSVGALHLVDSERGWPVFDLTVDLKPKAVALRRYWVFLKNFSLPIGIQADRVDILMPEDLRTRAEVPGLLSDNRYVRSMFVLTDGSIVAEIDAILLALQLTESLPENTVIDLDSIGGAAND